MIQFIAVHFEVHRSNPKCMLDRPESDTKALRLGVMSVALRSEVGENERIEIKVRKNDSSRG